jgi:single-stranded-DNA-specific exonuclease
VPLYGENRVLLEEGLRALRASERPGLKAMADAAGTDLDEITNTGRIVFTLGPRINAAGRMDSAEIATELLLAGSASEAEPLAQQLETLNRERQDLDSAIEEEAAERAERQITARTPHALVLYDPEWHLGVIGIVASSIVERYHKPTILLAHNGETVKGSARSIDGVNIYDALSQCEDVLTQFGGHDHAAGMSLDADQVEAFRDRFDEAVGEMVTPEILTPKIKVDAPLDLGTIGTVNDRFWAVLKQFGPFGPANPRPVFYGSDLAVVGSPRTVGSGDSHLKFRVRQADRPDDPSFDVIGFGMGDQLSILRQSQRDGRPLELLFGLEENTWRGETNLQLKAKDLRLQDNGEQ